MILTIDIGNTNITSGILYAKSPEQKPEALFVARMYTNKFKSGDEYAIDLTDIFCLYNVDISKVRGAIVSSVVPQLTDVLAEAVNRITGKNPVVVGPGIKTGLNICIGDPAELGSDLVATAVAAIDKYTLPCIVIDMGTATKVSAIGKGGVFLGCAIAPGLRVAVDALSEHTAQLPFISLYAPGKAIGTNTIDSMSSGIIYGNAALLDGMLDRFIAELKHKPESVVATGGYSHHVIPHCRHKIVYDEKMLLEGLYIIHEKNTA